MFTGRPAHLPSFDYVGFYRYSLTLCTRGRAEIFRDAARVEAVLAQILRAAADEGFAIVAYCFMPDHLHLLVQGEHETSNCLKFISRAKQLSGYHYKQIFGEPLWQRYGFERVLRDEEQTLVTARYMLENPLRQHLVQRVEDYPFLGSNVYAVSEILDAIQLSG